MKSKNGRRKEENYNIRKGAINKERESNTTRFAKCLPSQAIKERKGCCMPGRERAGWLPGRKMAVQRLELTMQRTRFAFIEY